MFDDEIVGLNILIGILLCYDLDFVMRLLVCGGMYLDLEVVVVGVVVVVG